MELRGNARADWRNYLDPERNTIFLDEISMDDFMRIVKENGGAEDGLKIECSRDR